MRIFSREQALAAGFDPAMYSQYPPEGEMIGQLDFAMTGTLFSGRWLQTSATMSF